MALSMFTTMLLMDATESNTPVRKGGPGSGPQKASSDAHAATRRADALANKTSSGAGTGGGRMHAEDAKPLHESAAKAYRAAADLHSKASAAHKEAGNKSEARAHAASAKNARTEASYHASPARWNREGLAPSGY